MSCVEPLLDESGVARRRGEWRCAPMLSAPIARPFRISRGGCLLLYLLIAGGDASQSVAQETDFTPYARAADYCRGDVARRSRCHRTGACFVLMEQSHPTGTSQSHPIWQIMASLSFAAAEEIPYGPFNWRTRFETAMRSPSCGISAFMPVPVLSCCRRQRLTSWTAHWWRGAFSAISRSPVYRLHRGQGPGGCFPNVGELLVGLP